MQRMSAFLASLSGSRQSVHGQLRPFRSEVFDDGSWRVRLVQTPEPQNARNGSIEWLSGFLLYISSIGTTSVVQLIFGLKSETGPSIVDDAPSSILAAVRGRHLQVVRREFGR
jgi:hypothetical protein